jgi:maleamate amidohydrolase
LLYAARAKGLPVIYTTGQYREDQWDMGSWAWKNGGTDDWDGRGQNRGGNDIIDEIAPQPQDIVIRKLKPSAFSSTPLNAFLTQLGADSLIVTGTSTSGCVRASVIDAFSENYRVTLAEEGCFDRSEASHAINLCDMNAKYANVVPTDEVINYIKTLPEELFNLPSGTPSAF